MNLPWNWNAAAKFVAFITALTVEVACDDVRPAWNEGSFLGEQYA